MPMNASQSKLALPQHLRQIRDRSRQRRLLRQSVLFGFVLMFVLLVTLATGCASRQPLPSEPLPSPPIPALSQPLPLQPYLTSASESFKRWQNVLMGTSATSKP